MDARKKAAEVESSLVPISKEISALEAKLSEQQQNHLRTEENIKRTKEAIISAEKELSTLESSPKNNERYKKRVEELNEFLRVARPAVGNMETNLGLYNREIQNTVASLDQLKERADKISLESPKNVSTDEEVRSQEEKIKSIQAEWNKAQKDVERYTKQIEKANEKLDGQKTEAGILTQEIDKSYKSQGLFKKAAEATETSMNRLGKRILGLASSALVFNVISRALTSLQQLTMKYIKTNDEARQAIAQMKGALLTLAQPLIEVLIPAFTLLVSILTQIITAVAQFVSMLFGKTLKQSKDGAKALHKEANAIGAVGEAADEAAGSLAGFDEINTINTENAKGAGGGGASTEDEIAPDFSWMDSMDSGFLDRLKEISDLVGLIGAGFALWKIGSMLPGVLGQIATILGGILMTVGGLLLFWNGLTDAWKNGVDWLNLIEMIGGLAAAAFGLYTIFEAIHPGWGKIAAGIALVVGGIAMLVTGFHDAMENGWNLENTLLSIAGILATGLGIALITRSWIPLLVAGIASVLLALTIATGHGEELLDGIRTIMEGFVDFFTGIFTGDIEKAIGGISKIFDGLKTAVFAVIDGIKDTLLSFLTWLDEKTGGKFHGIIEAAKGFVTEFFTSTKETLANVLDAVKQIFTGIIQFLTGVFTNDWDTAWEGVKNIFKGVWNGVVSILEGAINLIIKGLNWLISQMNKISFDVPDWVPDWAGGGKTFGINIPSISEVQIPRLAQGAVIPPNREFMAVLGDQRSGYNIEAPADLIRQMVIEGIQAAGISGGSNQPIQVNVLLDGKVVARNTVHHINDMTRQAGKPVLLI